MFYDFFETYTIRFYIIHTITFYAIYKNNLNNKVVITDTIIIIQFSFKNLILCKNKNASSKAVLAGGLVYYYSTSVTTVSASTDLLSR